MVRYILVGVLCTAILSCRDIQRFQDTTSIQGYQLNGTVTTPNGVPIEQVDVRLYYDYDFVSDSPSDTQQVAVTASLSLVDVAVYTVKYEFVRQIFFDYRTTGTVPRYRWNGRDRNGNVVPSGKYLIRYVVDTTIIKYSPWLVEGHSTDTTDTRGGFTLTSDRLPVGDVFDLYDSFNVYIGTYKVLPSIDIEFVKSSQTATYGNIALQKDIITGRTFILQ